jgi:hypothetical protein
VRIIGESHPSRWQSERGCKCQGKNKTFHFLVFKLPSVPMVLALFAAALVGVILNA